MLRAATDEGASLGLIQFREGDLEMRVDSFSAAGQEAEGSAAQDLSDRPGEGQRESSANAEKAPEAGVEHEASGAGRHGWSVAEPVAVDGSIEC